MELRKYEGGGRERLYFFHLLYLYFKRKLVFFTEIFSECDLVCFWVGRPLDPYLAISVSLKTCDPSLPSLRIVGNLSFFLLEIFLRKRIVALLLTMSFSFFFFFPDSNFHHLQRLPDLLIRTLWISLFALAQFPAEFCGYDTLPLLCARVLFSQLRSPAHMIDVRW